jgi:hypothetical protein
MTYLLIAGYIAMYFLMCSLNVLYFTLTLTEEDYKDYRRDFLPNWCCLFIIWPVALIFFFGIGIVYAISYFLDIIHRKILEFKRNLK